MNVEELVRKAAKDEAVVSWMHEHSGCDAHEKKSCPVESCRQVCKDLIREFGESILKNEKVAYDFFVSGLITTFKMAEMLISRERHQKGKCTYPGLIHFEA